MVLGKVELVLGFKQSMARMHDPEGDQKDAEFQRVKNEIINQHRYVCAGCGFRSVGAVTAIGAGLYASVSARGLNDFSVTVRDTATNADVGGPIDYRFKGY